MNFVDSIFSSVLLFENNHPPPDTAYDDPTVDLVYKVEGRGALALWLQSRNLSVSALPCELELLDGSGALAQKFMSLLKIPVPVAMYSSHLLCDRLSPFCEQYQMLTFALQSLIVTAIEFRKNPFPPGLAIEALEWENHLEHAFKRILLAFIAQAARLDHPYIDVYPDLNDRVPFDYFLFHMGMNLMESEGAADFGFGQAWAVHKSMLRSRAEDPSDQQFTHVIVDGAVYATHVDPRIAQNPDSHVLLNYRNDITLVPILIVERVKNGCSARSAHLYHLAIVMKSALAVYRRLGLSSIPVLGLLVERTFVRLIMGVPSAIAPEWLPWHAGSTTKYDTIVEPISTATTFRIVKAFEWFRIYNMIKDQHRRVAELLAQLTAPKHFKLSWRNPVDIPRNAICTWLPCVDKPTTHVAYRSKEMHDWLVSRRIEYFNSSSERPFPSNVQDALSSLLDVKFPQWILRAGRDQEYDYTMAMPGESEIRILHELILACEKADHSYDVPFECPTEHSRLHVLRAVCLVADTNALRNRDGESPRQDWAVVFNQFMDHLWADMWQEDRINQSKVMFHIAYNQRLYTHRAVSQVCADGGSAGLSHRDPPPDGATSRASSNPQYISPDVVFSVLTRGPFSLAAARDVDHARQIAWESEFSAEPTSEDTWYIVRIPLLIVEYVKTDEDGDIDHRGHLAMTMKSTLAVHRMYSMSEEVVFGLLIDRQTVTLSVAWDSQEANYVHAKDYVCSDPILTATFDICQPLDALRLRLVLFNLRAKGFRMVKLSTDDRIEKTLLPFKGQDVPDSVRWKEEHVSAISEPDVAYGEENITNWSAAVSSAEW